MHHHHHASVASSPRTVKYVGNVFAVHSGSLMITDTPAHAASEKHMALFGIVRIYRLIESFQNKKNADEGFHGEEAGWAEGRASEVVSKCLA